MCERVYTCLYKLYMSLSHSHQSKGRVNVYIWIRSSVTFTRTRNDTQNDDTYKMIYKRKIRKEDEEKRNKTLGHVYVKRRSWKKISGYSLKESLFTRKTEMHGFFLLHSFSPFLNVFFLLR